MVGKKNIIPKILTIKRTCPYCKKVQTVKVRELEFLSWIKGEKIGKAMPTLTPEEREILISGICPPCWDKLFKDSKDLE